MFPDKSPTHSTQHHHTSQSPIALESGICLSLWKNHIKKIQNMLKSVSLTSILNGDAGNVEGKMRCERVKSGNARTVQRFCAKNELIVSFQ